VTDRLAGLLPGEELEKALAGLEPEQITGPGGLLTQLAGRVIETALGAELNEHLGYPPGQAPPGGARQSPQRLDGEDGADRSGARRDPHATRPRRDV
jgi:transposase-like protein